KNIEDRQAMTLADLEIQRGVRGRYFWNASAELRVDCFIGDDRNFLTRERTPRVFSNEIQVSLLAWMKSHGGIRHDCFWPCGCDFQKAARLFHDFVSDKIELSFLRLGNDLFIRDSSLRSRIPVDHPATAIDQALAVKIDKNFLDGSSISIVERVALARPIA